jgi:hypothetical protein
VDTGKHLATGRVARPQGVDTREETGAAAMLELLPLARDGVLTANACFT